MKKNPYSGEIIDDKIYGRGSSDDKSCVAAEEIRAIKIGEFRSRILR